MRLSLNSRPYLTYAIIAACVVVWLGERANLTFYDRVVLFRPLVKTQPWRLLTSGFAHDPVQITHILFNMVSLYYLGTYLEGAIGRLRYAVIYVVSILGGALAFIAIGPTVIMTGASGGVFGLMCAAILIGRRQGIETNSLVMLLAFNSVMMFITPGIAWQDHVGGAIAGTLCALLMTGTLPPYSKGKNATGGDHHG